MNPPKIGVVIHGPLRDKLFDQSTKNHLSELGEVAWTDSDQILSTPEAATILHGCAIGVGSWQTPFPDAELMAACPDLRLWIHAAGSVKAFFGPHLDGRELAIASCAPAIAECVAEMVVGDLIVGLKRVLDNGAANRGGKVSKPENSKVLSSSVVGVVGASQVGRHVLEYLRPFRPEVLLYDPFISSEEARQLGARKVDDVDELCARSDAVTIHTPLLPATRHLMGRAQFQTMRDDAIFINCSRGGCVDEAALIEELEKGRLFAFLDVSDPEPALPNSPLRRLSNVVYTSHIAGGPEWKIGHQVADDIEAWIQNRPLRMQVTPEMLDRIA
jgi:phosphoglycerate dehydrogenase-like enzyme